MGNCLVTKLNQAVTGDLPYRTAIRYTVPAGVASFILRLVDWGDDEKRTVAPRNAVVTVVSNGYLKHPANETPLYTEGTPHTMINESLAVFPTDNTKPVEFIVEGFNSYSPGGYTDAAHLICKDCERFKYMPNAKYLNFQISDKVVDILEIINNPVFNISGVDLVSAGTNKIPSGIEITVFSVFTTATVMALANSGLVGTIEDLVAAFRTAGRTAPITDFIIGGNPGVTYEGHSVGTMWGHYTLSWTNNTISLTKNT